MFIRLGLLPGGCCTQAAVSEQVFATCKILLLLPVSLLKVYSQFFSANTPTICSCRVPCFSPRSCCVCQAVVGPCPHPEDHVAPVVTRDAPWCCCSSVLLLLLLLPSHCAPLMSLPQATKQFLEEINKWTGQYNVSPLSWNVAVKFLMARKFDVLRAIELFHSYRVSKQGRVSPPLTEGSLLCQQSLVPRKTVPLLFFFSPPSLMGFIQMEKSLFSQGESPWRSH